MQKAGDERDALAFSRYVCRLRVASCDVHNQASRFQTRWSLNGHEPSFASQCLAAVNRIALGPSHPRVVSNALRRSSIAPQAARRASSSSFARNYAFVTCHGERVASRAMVLQQKTQRPVQFEITPSTPGAVEASIRSAALRSDDYVFPSRLSGSPHPGTRQYARIVDGWVKEIGLDPAGYGTHSIRRTEPTLIYRNGRTPARYARAATAEISTFQSGCERRFTVTIVTPGPPDLLIARHDSRLSCTSSGSVM